MSPTACADATDHDLRIQLTPWEPLLDDARWLAEACAAITLGTRAGASPEPVPDLEAWAAARWRGATLTSIAAGSAGRVGFVVWRALGDAADAVAVEALAIRREARNLGYGAEAAEQLVASLPTAVVFAATPRSNGLALYFWLRVGFRPVRVDEVEWMALDPDRLWMVSAVGWSRHRGGPPAR